MAALEFYDVVDKQTRDGMYRALLGAALIEPDLFHMCVSFRAWSLRSAYDFDTDCKKAAAILEGRLDKIQLVYYKCAHGFYPQNSYWLYTIQDDSVEEHEVESVKRGGFTNVKVWKIMHPHTDIWRLLMQQQILDAAVLFEQAAIFVKMTAREYFEAVDKPGCISSYRALLGMALIDPDRFHMSESFRAHSLRKAYHCRETFKEEPTGKTHLVRYGNVSCFYKFADNDMYALYFYKGRLLVELYSISNIKRDARDLVKYARDISVDELMRLMQQWQRLPSFESVGISVKMAARDYFEAAFNEREDMYNALINSDRYHKCETFRAYSLRGTDFYSKIPKCYEDDTGGVKCS